MATFADNLMALIGVDRKKPGPSTTAGTLGTPIYAGMVDHGEKNPKLSTERKADTYQQIMLNTSVVAASVRYFLNLVAKAEWNVEPADDSSQAKQAAEYVEDVLEQMNTPWNRIIRRQATYKFYGFSVQEWTSMKRKDGRYGIRDIEMRPQRTINKWDVDANGNVLGIVQTHPMTFKEIWLPRGKVLYTVDDTLTDAPDGIGLMRHLVEPAGRLEMLLKLEGIGYENDLQGMPIARGPLQEYANRIEAGDLTTEQYNIKLQFLKDFIKNHRKNPELGLMLDSQTYRNLDEAQSPSSIRKWDVEILRGDGTGTIHQHIHNAIERLNREMARVTGTEGMLLGSDGGGSYALSEDKTTAFYMLVDSALTELAQAAAWDILWPLWKMNGLDPEIMPKLKPEAIQHRDVVKITQALKDMATAGVTLDPKDPACEEVRDLLGLSKTPMELIEEAEDKANAMIGALQQTGADAVAGKPDGKKPAATEKPEDEDDVPDPEEDEVKQPKGKKKEPK